MAADEEIIDSWEGGPFAPLMTNTVEQMAEAEDRLAMGTQVSMDRINDAIVSSVFNLNGASSLLGASRPSFTAVLSSKVDQPVTAPALAEIHNTIMANTGMPANIMIRDQTLETQAAANHAYREQQLRDVSPRWPPYASMPGDSYDTAEARIMHQRQIQRLGQQYAESRAALGASLSPTLQDQQPPRVGDWRRNHLNGQNEIYVERNGRVGWHPELLPTVLSEAPRDPNRVTLISWDTGHSGSSAIVSDTSIEYTPATRAKPEPNYKRRPKFRSVRIPEERTDIVEEDDDE